VRGWCALRVFLSSGVLFHQKRGGGGGGGGEGGQGRNEIHSYTYNLENYDYVILPKKNKQTKPLHG